MERKPTTKTVEATLKATFSGDYISADEVASHLEQWIDAGLEDRDDLRGWEFNVTTVTETEGRSDGADS